MAARSRENRTKRANDPQNDHPFPVEVWRQNVNSRKLINQRSLEPVEPWLRTAQPDVWAKEFPPVPEKWVHEFYTSYRLTEGNHFAEIDGVMVEVSPRTINRMFGIDIQSEGAEVTYHTPRTLPDLYDNSRLLEIVARTPPVLGDDEERSFDHQAFGPLHYNDMHLQARLLTYFVNASVLPTLHCTGMVRERAELVAALLQGQRINIGRYIFARITYVATSSLDAKISLPFPQLIGELCRLSGLQEPRRAKKIAMESPINMTSIHFYHEDLAYLERHGIPVPNLTPRNRLGQGRQVRPSRARGAGGQPPQAAEETAAGGEPGTSLTERIEMCQTSVEVVADAVQRLEQKVDKLARKQRAARKKERDFRTDQRARWALEDQRWEEYTRGVSSGSHSQPTPQQAADHDPTPTPMDTSRPPQ